jgi:hypothetical protein
MCPAWKSYRRFGPRVEEGKSYVHVNDKWAHRLQGALPPPSLHFTFRYLQPSQAFKPLVSRLISLELERHLLALIVGHPRARWME